LVQAEDGWQPSLHGEPIEKESINNYSTSSNFAFKFLPFLGHLGKTFSWPRGQNLFWGERILVSETKPKCFSLTLTNISNVSHDSDRIIWPNLLVWIGRQEQSISI
jgi:hypothetical protein